VSLAVLGHKRAPIDELCAGLGGERLPLGSGGVLVPGVKRCGTHRPSLAWGKEDGGRLHLGQVYELRFEVLDVVLQEVPYLVQLVLKCRGRRLGPQAVHVQTGVELHARAQWQ